MLLRGQNLLGYKHYPDDVVRKFVELSVKNGIDVIRIFDALNDLQNLEVAVGETVRHGAEAQVAISYTTSPVHTLEAYAALAKRLEEMGASSICIKDMAGIMGPRECFELVKAIEASTGLRLHLHTHATTGLAFMSYLKGVEAGADVIDTAISAFSGGTSQPATETLVYALTQLGYETGVDYNALKEINDYFRPIQQEYVESGQLDAKVMGTDTDALNYQIPGGMLSNLISQLKASNAMDKFPLVLEEPPGVRKDLGYPPLVTPTRQIVGAQAAVNVLTGERYSNVSNEVRAYLRGEYGTPPGEVDPALVRNVLGDEKPCAGRYAASLPEGFGAAKQEIGALAKSDEDVLSTDIGGQGMDQIQTTVTVAAGSLAIIAVVMLAVCVKFTSAVNRLLARQPQADMMPVPAQACAPADYAAPWPVELNGLDEETAAMLMAITADTVGVPPDELRFISIKEC